MAFNPTTNTWNQIANEQAYNEFDSGNLNSRTLITEYDPIYNKLVQQISYTMYRRLEILQKWTNLGRTAPYNAYPGILREVAMKRRKGQNFPADNGTAPDKFNCYDRYDDQIDVRYHSAQYRWMYPYTIYDEELRRYSGGNGMMIAELTEMKMQNAISARNMFVDALRKKTLATMAATTSKTFNTGIDISNFATLTQDQAQQWLMMVDDLLFEFEVGTSLYNGDSIFTQTPKGRLQMVMPRNLYYRVVRKAFPDTFHQNYFENILPDNLILIDTLGDDILVNNSAQDTPIEPTFNSVGMNLLNWDEATQTIKPEHTGWQAIIMDRDCLGFEDNLDNILFAPKDIEKLATAVRVHYWTKAYFTDLLPSVVIQMGG